MLVMHITNEGFVSRRYKNFVQTIRGRGKKKEKWAKDRKRQLTKKKRKKNTRSNKHMKCSTLLVIRESAI